MPRQETFFWGDFFFGVDVGCLCFFCLGVVETNHDVEWGSKNSTNRIMRNLMKRVCEVKVMMDVGGDVFRFFLVQGGPLPVLNGVITPITHLQGHL